MAVKTVNAEISSVLTKSVTANAAKTGKTSQTSQSNADEKDSLSFGSFLNKKLDTAAKSTLAAKPTMTTQTKTDASGGVKQESAKTAVTGKTDKAQDNRYDTKQSGADNAKKTAADKMSESKEPADADTAQVAEALSQVLDSIKEELGVSDEEILAGLEETGLHPTDLLNADNLALLVTNLAGDGEMMSLVTDGELYTTLQSLTQTVETLTADLLEETGLTQEEFDFVLEQLSVPQETREPLSEQPQAELSEQPMAEQPRELPMQEEPLDFRELTEVEPQETEAAADEEVTQTVNASETLMQEETPVVIVSDNTVKPAEAKTTSQQLQDNGIERLAQSREENPVEARTQTQKSDNGAHHEESGEKSYDGQQGAAQSFNENVSEAAQTAETVTGYTSETTESLLNQLADVVRIIRNENLTEMELQLHPASLGTVNVSLVTKGGAVTAEFTTQNEAVKAAIEAQAAQLIENLEEQGVKVEAVEVSVASHELEHELDKNNQGEQSKEEQEEQQRVQGVRRRSINLNSLGENDEELLDELAADDATRIAMEIMTANGNSMDLLA